MPANILELLCMKGWKYNAHIKVRPMTNAIAEWGGGIVVQKWREGGVSVNTFYFTFRNCCESGVNLLWDCIESVQKM